MVERVNYPDLGEVPIPGMPIKLSLTPGHTTGTVPKIGEHNEEVYCGLLGLGTKKLSELKQKKLI
jgi:crotonobetainyl-CoA:carnitine CoA-transferase CaiB-like acyl-CoA transferase